MLTVSSIGLNDGLAVGPPSNYGLGEIDLTAPGGDFTQGAPPSGLVLGPWPASMQVPRLVCDPCSGPDAAYYRFFAGTSQAAAQVSGAAALVVSQFGKKSWLWGGKMDPDRVSLILRQTADPLPCPAADARCVTGGNENGFFGKGVVNALRAVTYDKRASPGTRMLGRGRQAALTAAISSLDRRLRVAEEHRRVRAVEEVVVDAGEARAHAALEDDDVRRRSTLRIGMP